MQDLRVQLDMLSLGHLYPNITDPTLLRDHLLEGQAKLPRHLKLLADPATELWHYYNSQGCLTLVENNRLLIVVSLSLLDSCNIYVVFQVINLPIPYPHRKQGSGTVAKYKLESENIALDLTRKKFMLLTPLKQKSVNMIYSELAYQTAQYIHLCVMEIYRDDRRGIQQHCLVEILLDVILPKVVRITDGVWAITSRDASELSQVGAGKSPKTIKITPPLSILRVPIGSGVYGDSITLPPYYQAEEKFVTSNAFLSLVNTTLIRGMGLWEPLIRKFSNITSQAIPEILSPFKNELK